MSGAQLIIDELKVTAEEVRMISQWCMWWFTMREHMREQVSQWYTNTVQRWLALCKEDDT